MQTRGLTVVTGAFSFTGKHITRRLLSAGNRVLTLTSHPQRHNPFGNQVEAAPFNFDKPEELAAKLEDASIIYNTYWIRFSHRGLTFSTAVENTRTLISAARVAGVRKLVHISVANASEASPFPYFRAKGIVERIIINSGLRYVIIRPTLTFGPEDILINNIGWLLRKFPLFPVFGSGKYRVQPVFVEDVAEVAVEAAADRDNIILDVAGPEVYGFGDLVRLIANNIGSRARIVHVPPVMALLLARVVGYLVRDVVVTPDEVKAVMAELLVSDGGCAGCTCLPDWLDQNADSIGAEYRSELGRHYR